MTPFQKNKLARGQNPKRWELMFTFWDFVAKKKSRRQKVSSPFFMVGEYPFGYVVQVLFPVLGLVLEGFDKMPDDLNILLCLVD